MAALAKLPSFETIEEIIAAAAEIINPPERMSVSECAAEYRHLYNPGSYVGKWKNETTPYMVEPMDELESFDYTGWCFVGPARTGKSDSFFNWLTYAQLFDPSDMLFYAMTANVARDISQGDLKKLFRHTTKLGEKLVEGRNKDNVYDKHFKSGVRLLLRWPVMTELSGKTVRRVWLADYDRMPMDVDKEGSPFELARKRTTTFRRFGMTAVESSPGFEITDPKWYPKTPHEAPPCDGILSIYNNGDRRRWYVRCLHCRTPFEADFHHIHYPKSDDLYEASEMATLRCPNPECGYDHDFTQRAELNEHIKNARWVKDKMIWTQDGKLIGNPVRSDIASFWLNGTAAAFQSWQSLVFKYLQALRTLENTGKDSDLKKTITADQGKPYLPPSLANGRTADSLRERSEDWGGSIEAPVVPEGVRFLEATIDVQAGARAGFVVQVTGFGEGNDAYVIDMFRLLRSERLDENQSTGEKQIYHQMNPGAYLEDWKLLVPAVLFKTYPLGDGSGRRMGVKLTGCDYGGESGVSTMARAFYRWLRQEHGDSVAKSFQLIKGEPSRTAPTFQIKYPDANQRDKFTAARGDVPVAFLNSLEIKDNLSGLLDRVEPGGGMWHFPRWAPDWFYSQMTVETRTEKGWVSPNNSRKRNESWDLSYYALGLLRHPSISAHRANFWENPPLWASPWDKNSLVFEETGADEGVKTRFSSTKYDLKALGQKLIG